MVFSKIKILLLTIILCSCNPFAPSQYEGDQDALVIGDQTKVEGVFQNWRYSYIFADTSVYSNLLDENFSFVYRNYDLGIDNSWGREVDLRTTRTLFDSTESIDLIWNEIVYEIGDSLSKNILRSFNLQLVFGSEDITRINGRANIQLIRKEVDDDWKIEVWRDESNY
jgi:hypothetical protein